MKRFCTLVVILLLLGLKTAALAQDNTCPAIVQSALSAVDRLCGDTGGADKFTMTSGSTQEPFVCTITVQ